MHCFSRRQAFTLVELAIVLVVLGIVVGGVLTAQTLIQQSAIRSTIKQLDYFNNGAATFKVKYRGLPGDLHNLRARDYGFTTRSGAPGRGDGSGSIQNGVVLGEVQGLGYETGLFWRDLSRDRLLPMQFDTATDVQAVSISRTDLPLWVPVSRMSDNVFWHVYSFQSRNFFYLGGFAPAPTDANGVLSLANAVKTEDASSIDEKIDDSYGDRGNIISVNALATNAVLSGTGLLGECLNANGTYNVIGDNATGGNCRLSIRSSF